ncbi:MAG: ABC transporter substrate-binding protein [Chloroflexota bacterium]|nr:ABC transporter substrate-binding protein [Chloroflexota bacterium]
MTHDIFVSYSSKDKAVADTIVASLEKNNIRCWYAPRDIKPGDDWGSAITAAIEDSNLFLIIFSGNANQSQRVLDEVNFAISEEIPILPFRIENLDPVGAMKLHLSSRHWLDAYEPSWEVHIKKLVSDVSTILEVKIEEERIQLPDGVEKVQHQEKKRKWVKILVVLAVVLILGTMGWFSFPALFSPTSKLKLIDTPFPSKVPQSNNITGVESEQESNSTPTETVLEPMVREGVLDTILDSSLSFDPQNSFLFDNSSLAENLFLNLVNIDTENGKIVPEAAESWTISPDGRLYTFTIRPDIPWVTHTLSGETEQVFDESGEPRMVTPYDFVYAIQRLCDPNVRFDFNFGEDFVPMIAGCNEVFTYEDPQNIPQDLIQSISAKAVSDTELLIELTSSQTYFLSLTANPIFTPLPAWAIEKYGDAWTNPGLIPTNGYFVIDDLVLGESLSLERNPFLPEDLAGEGNIGQINFTLGNGDSYSLWENNEIDLAYLPHELSASHIINYPNKIYSQTDRGVFWISLNTNKAPFDNPQVRRAFAAAFNKESIGTLTYKLDYGILNDLVLPGAIAAPDSGESKLSYDPESAQKELAEAGYLNCQGFPVVHFYNYMGTYQLSEMDIRDWETALGCPENTIIIDEAFIGFDQTDMITAGVLVGDDQALVYEYTLHCNNPFIQNRYFSIPCGPIDDLIESANQKLNLAERTALYQEIEETLFGEEGTFRIIPLAYPISNYAVHDWLYITTNPRGVPPYYQWSVDMSIKP